MESAWSIDFKLSARKEFLQLDDRAKAEAKKAIADLAEDPFPEGSVELRVSGPLPDSFLSGSLSQRLQRFGKAAEGVCATGPPPWFPYHGLSSRRAS